jgi:hypothetical protein
MDLCKKDCYLLKFAHFCSPFYAIYSEICVSKAAIASSSTRYGYRTRVGSWIFYSCHLFLLFLFLNGRAGVWKDPEDSYHIDARYKVKQGLF